MEQLRPRDELIPDIWWAAISQQTYFFLDSRLRRSGGGSLIQRIKVIYIKQASLRLLCSSDEPTLIRVLGPTQAYTSTSHSYQTLESSVCRHMLTSSSESCGK